MIHYAYRLPFGTGDFTSSFDNNFGSYTDKIFDVFLCLVCDPLHCIPTLGDQGRTTFHINCQQIQIVLAEYLQLIKRRQGFGLHENRFDL